MTTFPVTGTGLGLRRALMGPLSQPAQIPVDLLEVAPENWIPMGGSLAREFRSFTERYPFVSHGLSLSLGGPEPLDFELLGNEIHMPCTLTPTSNLVHCVLNSPNALQEKK